MEYRANGHDLVVVVDSFYAANRFCEQPRTHRVIEQIRLGKPLRILDHRCDKRIVYHADACNQSCPWRVVIGGRLRGRIRRLIVAEPFKIHRTPRMCLTLNGPSQWSHQRSCNRKLIVLAGSRLSPSQRTVISPTTIAS